MAARSLALCLVLLGCLTAAAEPPLTAEQQAQLKERDELVRRAEGLESEGKYDEALAAAGKILELTRAVRGPEHSEIADALQRLAALHELAGQLDAAIKVRQETLALSEKLDGDKHWRTADARLALELTRKVAALPEADRVEAVAALRQEEQARRLWQQGKGVETGRAAAAALVAYRKHLGDGIATARALQLLGLARWKQRDLKGSQAANEQVLAIQRKVLPLGNPAIANSLNNLGVVQRELRDYAAALRSHEEALAILRKAWPKDHPDIAMSLNNLGVVQQELRDYAAALRSHEEALAIRRKALPPGHPDIAMSFNNLGIVQRELRDYAAALRSHEEALAILRKAWPKDHPDIATSLNNLGIVQRDLRDYAAARRSHEEALAIRREALPKNHPAIARSLNNLGNVQRDLRDYAAARRSYEEVLAIFRKALPEGHPDIAMSLNNLGVVQQELREYAAARRSFEEALAIRREALPKDHPDIATSLYSLGLLCLKSADDPQTAFPLLTEAVAIRQRDLSRLALAQAEAEQFYAAAEHRTALDVLLSVGPPPESDPGNDRYAAVVGFKGAITARQRWARRGRELADPEAARLLRQLQQANSQLLATALADWPSARAEDLRELSERRARLERELAARSAAYRRFLQQGRRSPADIRAALPAGTALLDCLDYLHFSKPAKGEHDLRYEARLVVFVVRPDRKGVVEVPLGSAERLADLIDRWRASHGCGKTPPADQPDPATELRKLIWEPLEKDLDGVKVVLVSPDGPLNGLPPAALPGREPGKFLVHHYAFAVVPVPQLLPDLLVDKPHTPRERPTLLLAGNIHFGEPCREAKAGSNRLPPLPAFAALPGSESEVNDLAARFQRAFADAPRPVLLSEDKATKAAFLQAAPKAHYLHLATHGFFANEAEKSALDPAERASLGLRPEVSGRHPGLLSGVVFAGVNDPEHKPDEAVLTALEASELDLEGAELVTLSACDTGRGAVAGGEGVLGLQRALQLSGARSVLASLWKVRDEDTHRLMREFYKRLWSDKPLAKVEALRQAQLWLLEHGGARSGLELPEKPTPASPYIWAAFVLSGDWR
jgi:CHAT domain-containing protein